MAKSKFRTLGWQVIDWIETYLCHGPGDVQGQPIELDDEFARFLLKAYELYPDGRRKVRRAFLSRPKGRAKSELAGMLACVEGLGPVRFDGWDSDKEPVGRPVTAPEILCVATEEGQAGNTYDNVTYMLSHLAENHGDEFPGIDPGLTRCFLAGGGEIAPVTAKARSKDGGKSTFVVFDETHLYETTELRALHATIRRNLGKRKLAEPWSLETSTMYRPGANSVAEATHEYARAIADGRLKDEGLLFDHREGPDDFDWTDDEALRAALKDVYGPASEWMDLDRIVREIRDPQSDDAESQRYWLNKVVRATDQAFDVEKWAQLADPTRVIADGELVVLGFDGARFHDATALVGTHVESGHQFALGIWERLTDQSDWEVPDDEVEQILEEAFDRWDVWRLYADPPYWESQVNSWVARWGDKRVLAWWTNRNRPMAFALRSYATAQQAGDLTHDGDSTFARHIGNARRRDTRIKDETGRFMWVIHKEHPNSPNKIDAAMAGCLSWEARGDAIAAGVLTKRKRSRVPVGF